MLYDFRIMNNKAMNVLQFDNDDIDLLDGKVTRKIPHISKVSTCSKTQSKSFKFFNDMTTFINTNKQEEKHSNSFYFLIVAYDITVNNEYVLYYELNFSNS